MKPMEQKYENEIIYRCLTCAKQDKIRSLAEHWLYCPNCGSKIEWGTK